MSTKDGKPKNSNRWDKHLEKENKSLWFGSTEDAIQQNQRYMMDKRINRIWKKKKMTDMQLQANMEDEGRKWNEDKSRDVCYAKKLQQYLENTQKNQTQITKTKINYTRKKHALVNDRMLRNVQTKKNAGP